MIARQTVYKVAVGIIVILFMLPAYAPGTLGDNTFNYAPIAVVFVVVLATVLWFAKGRKHFMTNDEAEHLTVDAKKLLE